MQGKLGVCPVSVGEEETLLIRKYGGIYGATLTETAAFILLLGEGIRVCKIEARGKDLAICISYTGGDEIRKKVERISDRLKQMLEDIYGEMR